MYAGIDNMNLKVNEVVVRIAGSKRCSVSGCKQHGGLPMVLLQRHRRAERLEQLGTVPSGECTQHLFQTRYQVAVMQKTLHCRCPFDRWRPRHGQVD